MTTSSLLNDKKSSKSASTASHKAATIHNKNKIILLIIAVVDGEKRNWSSNQSQKWRKVQVCNRRRKQATKLGWWCSKIATGDLIYSMKEKKNKHEKSSLHAKERKCEEFSRAWKRQWNSHKSSGREKQHTKCNKNPTHESWSLNEESFFNPHPNKTFTLFRMDNKASSESEGGIAVHPQPRLCVSDSRF